MFDLGWFTALFVGGALFVVAWWKVFTRQSTRKDINFIPGDWPLLGHLPILMDLEKFRALSHQWYEDFDGTFGCYLLTKKMVSTRDLKVIEDLLSSSKYLKKSWGYMFLEALIGKGLVTSEGDLWKERRRLITPSFHFDILTGFLPVMERCTKELMGLFDEHAKNDTSFNVLNMGTKLTMAVICETSMGQRLSLTDKGDSDFKSLYENATSLMVNRVFRPWLMNDFLYSLTKDGKLFLKQRHALRSWVKNIIEERIKFRKDKSKENVLKNSRKIFIDVLLDAFEKGEINIEGMIDEVTTLIFAGYESTSSTFAFALYCLGRNPECQERLLKETFQFSKSENFGLDDLKKMIYLEQVIKETLRLHAILNGFAREIKAGTVLGGKVFPECALALDIQALNHFEKNWENPLSFKPERFEDFENRRKDKAFMFIPFSAGPRNCVGQRFAMMELKIALFQLVKRFEIISLQNELEIKQTFTAVNTSTNGLLIKVKYRTK